MTFAVAAGADIVSVAAILQKTASAIGVLADGPIQRPRDLDGKTYAGFGYPNEDPTLKFVIKADGGKGDVQDRDPRRRGLRGALQPAGGLHDPVHRLGGRRGDAAGHQAALLPVRRLRLPRVLPGRPRLRPAVAPEGPRRGEAVRGATVKGFQFAADNADEAAAILVSENPGVFDANKELPKASQEFLDQGHYLVDASGDVRDADPRALDGATRSSCTTRACSSGSTGKPLAAAARLRDAVHERLPAVTTRAGQSAGSAAPPVRPAARARRRSSSSPGRSTPAPRASARSSCRRRPRCSARSGTSAARRSATRSRRSSRRVVGFSLSIVGATAVAVALDRVGWARRAVEPLLVGSQTIPIVAIAPLIVVWFGFGLLPKVLVVVLVTFFPITIALLDGFASTSAEATELMRSFGASAGQTFRKVRWPSGLPAFFTGSGSRRRYGVVAAVIGEYVGATEGSGSGCSSASARSGPISCSPRSC